MPNCSTCLPTSSFDLISWAVCKSAIAGTTIVAPFPENTGCKALCAAEFASANRRTKLAQPTSSFPGPGMNLRARRRRLSEASPPTWIAGTGRVMGSNPSRGPEIPADQRHGRCSSKWTPANLYETQRDGSLHVSRRTVDAAVVPRRSLPGLLPFWCAAHRRPERAVPNIIEQREGIYRLSRRSGLKIHLFPSHPVRLVGSGDGLADLLVGAAGINELLAKL